MQKTTYMLLVALIGWGCSPSTTEEAGSDACFDFESSNMGTVTATISGSDVSIDWDNDISEADSLEVSIAGPVSVSTTTKPAVFNSLSDGAYSASVTYTKGSCQSVTTTKNFTVDTSADCSSWDLSTVAGTITTTPSVGAVDVSWSGGTIAGEDSFEVTVSGVTADQTVSNANPASFTGMSPGDHTATILYAKAGCSDKTQTSSTFTIPTSFSNDVIPLLTSCMGCHGSNGGFTVSSYSDWTSETTSVCGGSTTRVTPGDGGNSVWYKKVTSTDCGTQMGTGGNGSLSASNIETIKTWIDQGAANN